MRGRTTGAIEVYHAVCLLFSCEPLGAPLTSVVRGLIANFEAHGVRVVNLFSVARGGGRLCPP